MTDNFLDRILNSSDGEKLIRKAAIQVIVAGVDVLEANLSTGSIQ